MKTTTPYRKAREDAGIGFAEAVRLLDTSVSTLWRYESGKKMRRFDADLVAKMAALYKCTVDQLLGRSPLPEPAAS